MGARPYYFCFKSREEAAIKSCLLFLVALHTEEDKLGKKATKKRWGKCLICGKSCPEDGTCRDCGIDHSPERQAANLADRGIGKTGSKPWLETNPTLK